MQTFRSKLIKCFINFAILIGNSIYLVEHIHPQHHFHRRLNFYVFFLIFFIYFSPARKRKKRKQPYCMTWVMCIFFPTVEFYHAAKNTIRLMNLTSNSFSLLQTHPEKKNQAFYLPLKLMIHFKAKPVIKCFRGPSIRNAQNIQYFGSVRLRPGHVLVSGFRRDYIHRKSGTLATTEAYCLYFIYLLLQFFIFSGFAP